MSTPTEELTDFLDELDAHGVERVIVRWTDETRPVPHEESGFTVRRVTRATLTAVKEGEPVQQSFEGIGHDELRDVVDQYPFETFYRSDNLTR